MALNFSVSTADTVDVAAAASINSLPAYTMIAWIYATSSAATSAIMQKGRTGTNSARQLQTDNVLGTSINLRVFVDRATLDCTYKTSSSPVLVNTWTCVAATFDENATPAVHIYSGLRNMPMAECLYNTATDGSGVSQNDSADPLCFGNLAAHNSGFRGLISWGAYFNRVLSLAEIRSWAAMPNPTMFGCVCCLHLGAGATAVQPDLSGHGNNGTITGARMAPDPVFNQSKDLLLGRLNIPAFDTTILPGIFNEMYQGGMVGRIWV